MFKITGFLIMPYVSQVEDVLKKVLKLVNKEAHQMALSILRNLLLALSQICLADKAKLVSQHSEFPLDDWGRPTDLSDLNVKWFIPGS